MLSRVYWDGLYTPAGHRAGVGLLRWLLAPASAVSRRVLQSWQRYRRLPGTAWDQPAVGLSGRPRHDRHRTARRHCSSPSGSRAKFVRPADSCHRLHRERAGC